MSRNLINVLNDVGKATNICTTPDGTKVLVLPYGGRVLGVYAPDNDENFYWTNPALDSTQTAKMFYDSNEWHNSGGDRTWLAPEVDVFFPKFPNTDMSTYFQPRQMDPGNYRIEASGSGFRMENDLEIVLSRSKQRAALRISKALSPAPNPLRHEDGVPEVEYAGYTQTTSLEVRNAGENEACVGLWNLVQMPHGGDLLVSTYVKTEPRIYFGSVTSEDLIASEHLLRYKMRAVGEHKIGVRAVAVTGRVGYLYPAGSKGALIIRNFAVNPSGEYIDVPWGDTRDVGYAAQACNVNSALGSFSELEYHIPAIGHGTSRSACDDIAQVWAFRGSLDAVRSIAGRLLSDQV